MSKVIVCKINKRPLFLMEHTVRLSDLDMFVHLRAEVFQNGVQITSMFSGFQNRYHIRSRSLYETVQTK